MTIRSLRGLLLELDTNLAYPGTMLRTIVLAACLLTLYAFRVPLVVNTRLFNGRVRRLSRLPSVSPWLQAGKTVVDEEKWPGCKPKFNDDEPINIPMGDPILQERETSVKSEAKHVLRRTSASPASTRTVDEEKWPGCIDTKTLDAKKEYLMFQERYPSVRVTSRSDWPGVVRSVRKPTNRRLDTNTDKEDQANSRMHPTTAERPTGYAAGRKSFSRTDRTPAPKEASVAETVVSKPDPPPAPVTPPTPLTAAQKYALAIKRATNPTTTTDTTTTTTTDNQSTTTPTTTTVSAATRKKNKEAELMQSMLAAMQEMKPSNRVYDPVIELNHPDDQLGYISDTFRSGFVSILGNPNVGKSTLLNHLLQQDLCIVSPKPQTTRHRIFGILTRMPANETVSVSSGSGGDSGGGSGGSGVGIASTSVVGSGSVVGTPATPTSTTTTSTSTPTATPHTTSTIPATTPSTLEQYQREGYQLVIADTPGMLTPAYKLQEVMQSSVRTAEREGDVVLVVTDVYGEPLQDKKIMDKLQLTTRPVIVAINKVDIAGKGGTNWTSSAKPVVPSDVTPTTDPEQYLSYWYGDNDDVDEENKVYNVPQSFEALKQLWQTRLPNAQVVGISAKLGTGVPWLLYTVLQHIQTGPMYYPRDYVADRDERFFATEIVRECLLELYHEEIPYSCEVVMEGFEDKGDGFSVLSAAIVVSRRSQKGIIIGAKGNKLRELGTLARKKLEKFLGRGVYLSLRVKVDEEWRSKDAALTKYGYIHKK